MGAVFTDTPITTVLISIALFHVDVIKPRVSRCHLGGDLEDSFASVNVDAQFGEELAVGAAGPPREGMISRAARRRISLMFGQVSICTTKPLPGVMSNDLIAGHGAATAAVSNDEALAAAYGDWTAAFHGNRFVLGVVRGKELLGRNVSHQFAIANCSKQIIEPPHTKFGEYDTGLGNPDR